MFLKGQKRLKRIEKIPIALKTPIKTRTNIAIKISKVPQSAQNFQIQSTLYTWAIYIAAFSPYFRDIKSIIFHRFRYMMPFQCNISQNLISYFDLARSVPIKTACGFWVCITSSRRSLITNYNRQLYI